jgi:histidinol-phosphate phosphatase family protein
MTDIDLTPPIDLYLFDVDGTLVTTKSGETFRKTADDWQWLPGRKEALQALLAQGKHIALVTNQGGVAFGYFRIEDMRIALETLAHDLWCEWPDVEDICEGIDYFACWTHPTGTVPSYTVADDFHRKPNPGMLLQAMLEHQVGPTNTLMVGDMTDDARAAVRAGCRFEWANEFFTPPSVVVDDPATVQDIEITDNLLDDIERYLNMPRRVPVIEASPVELMGEFDLTYEQVVEVRRRLRARYAAKREEA